MSGLGTQLATSSLTSRRCCGRPLPGSTRCAGAGPQRRRIARDWKTSRPRQASSCTPGHTSCLPAPKPLAPSSLSQGSPVWASATKTLSVCSVVAASTTASMQRPSSHRTSAATTSGRWRTRWSSRAATSFAGASRTIKVTCSATTPRTSVLGSVTSSSGARESTSTAGAGARIAGSSGSQTKALAVASSTSLSSCRLRARRSSVASPFSCSA
mmetsp:Transcript_117496/g.328953  ORF Transcript_117496/g.328953 Transcript_117496/m.328953 type:complete len:213 (-) Transcript_117496:117-755(-)